MKMIHVCGCFRSREVSKHLLRNFSVSRSSCDTHYEVLQIPKTCSQKDIKDAFIKLSKEYHPDKNSDASTHGKFVRLNEAYTVLSRPESRRNYDLSLVPDNYNFRSTRRFFYDNDFADDKPNPRAFRDSSFWENRDRSKDQENLKKPYYGIKGIKRMSNSWILAVLFVVVAFGVGLQLVLIRNSVTFSRKSLDARSAANSEIYRDIRAQALVDDDGSSIYNRLLQKNVHVGRIPQDLFSSKE